MKMWMNLLALVVLACPVGAAEMDKQRLRRLVDMPTVSLTAEFCFSTSYGFYFNSMKPDPLVEIARIRKELKGDDGDAKRYLRLGILTDASMAVKALGIRQSSRYESDGQRSRRVAESFPQARNLAVSRAPSDVG